MIKRIETAALLVRSVPYGEADLIVTFFTEAAGKIGAAARGARRSAKRFGGALESIHELFVVLEDKGRELTTLKEARISKVRTGVVSDLDAMDAAGHALRWVRHLCPVRTPEPAVWRSATGLLDALDRGPGGAKGLGPFGLRLLADVGYALELERCVRCGRTCPEGRAAFVDPAGGGLVCTSCGGARRTISPAVRALAIRAQRGEEVAPSREEHGELVAIVEEAMAAHADFDPTRR